MTLSSLYILETMSFFTCTTFNPTRGRVVQGYETKARENFAIINKSGPTRTALRTCLKCCLANQGFYNVDEDFTFHWGAAQLTD